MLNRNLEGFLFLHVCFTYEHDNKIKATIDKMEGNFLLSTSS